jgi:hypothetical protein
MMVLFVLFTVAMFSFSMLTTFLMGHIVMAAF